MIGIDWLDFAPFCNSGSYLGPIFQFFEDPVHMIGALNE
jgi:hypothetical protein